jgi:phytanoyl-CoA hydroxylase
MMQTIKQHYLDQGYAVLKNAVSVDEMASIRAAAAQIVDEFDSERHRTVFSTRDRDRGRDRYFMDSAEAVHCFLEEDALDGEGNLVTPKERAINKIGHAMHDLVPEFTQFCRLPVFRQVLDAIGYRDPLLWQTMYIFKQAHIGGEVRWHQDASYLITDPSSVVGFWIALEDSDRNNGCLRVRPGGHRSALREIYRVDAATQAGELSPLNDEPWPGQDEGLPVEVAAGSLVIFNDHMPHYSAPNRSGRSRQAFTMHFAEAASEWSGWNWLQRTRLPPFRL